MKREELLAIMAAIIYAGSQVDRAAAEAIQKAETILSKIEAKRTQMRP